MKKQRKFYGNFQLHRKIVCIMKLTILFSFVFVISASAVGYSQSAKLSLKLSNQSLVDALKQIEDQSEFYFYYNNNDIVGIRGISVNIQDAGIEKVLDELLLDTGLNYKMIDRYIVIKPVNEAVQTNMSAQQGKVAGVVKDAAGMPLPGVTVSIKGTSTGTITQSDGSFSLAGVPDDAILVFSFVGMRSQEVPVNGKSLINVSMEEETIGLEEVVAVGYGTQKKVNLTGAVVAEEGAEMLKAHTPNVVNSVIGKLPGVIINNRSGEPGRDDPTVYIRGRSTTGSTSPLVVIDGVVRDGLGQINPYDIETVTVLKDAAAAIYGARAANGVILVTTKKGAAGKPTLQFSYNQGFSQPTRSVKMADSYEFATVYNEIEVSQGRDPYYTEEELQKFKDGTDPNYPNTDWYDYMTKTLTPQHRMNLSASGGNDRVDYFLSIGQMAQDGQFREGTTKVKRYNFRSNIGLKVSDALKIGFNVAGRYDDKHYPREGANNLYSHIYLYHPTWTAYWPGTNYLRPNRDSENILNWVSDNAGTNDQQYKSVEATLNFVLDIPWIKGLSVNGSANWDGNYNYNKLFRKPTYVYYKNETSGEYYKARAGSGVDLATLSNEVNQSSTLTSNVNINYEHRFNQHNIGAMMGYEQMEYDYDYLYAYRSDFPSTALPILNAGSSDKNKQSNSGTSSKMGRQNVFGRATYDFAGKYLAQFIFRVDGSSNFSPSNRWGFFPGASVGWRISEEPFLQSWRPVVDNLKIRASYGEMGNDAVDAYQYLMTYAYGNNYVIGNNDVIGLVQSGVPNPDITWEVAKTTNIGLESTLWKGKLGIELDLFKTKRSNILTTRNAVIPDYTGLQLPDENIGEVENKGFEIQLSHQNKVREVSYSLQGNFSFARNKVLFTDEAPAAEEYQLATGKPIGSGLYYRAIGIFATQEEIDAYPHMPGAQPGDIIYEDINKDESINSRDMYRETETVVPEIVYGLSASVQYKNFDLSLLFQGQANAKVFMGSWSHVLSTSLGNFPKWRSDDHWTPDRIHASMPRASYELWNNNSNETSTQWLLDSDFLRLKNLELGYTLPAAAAQKLGIGNLRFYVSGNNLLILFDHMKDAGFDPETSDYWWYPQQRVFNAGIDLTF